MTFFQRLSSSLLHLYSFTHLCGYFRGKMAEETTCSSVIESVMTKYGFNFQLKQEQSNGIQNLLKGEDTLVCAPTSFGKSIIYTLPSLILDEVSNY